MTKGERDYSQGKIYKIVCNVTGKQYVGHTSKKYLSQRLSKHKSSYNSWKNKLSDEYITSFEVLENGDYDIILLENCPCNDVHQLRIRERYWIENIKGGCVNKNIPSHTKYESDKKYRERNKEEIQEYKKKYRESNCEYICQRNKDYYKKNKQVMRENAKQYYEKNKDQILSVVLKYKQDHKQELQLKRKETTICGCGQEITKINLKRHLLSKKHEEHINK